MLEVRSRVRLNPFCLRISIWDSNTPRSAQRRKDLREWYARAQKNARSNDARTANASAAMDSNHLATLNFWHQRHNKLV
jgi:hypothetical protein